MWSAWLIPVLLLFGAARPGHLNHTHSGLSCVNNYINRISCTWQRPALYSAQTCNLKAKKNSRHPKRIIEQDCPLKFDSDAPCIFSITSLNFAARFSLKVICNGTVVTSLEDYNPGRHIKLDPLDRPSVYRGNISWNKVSISVINYQYQLQFKNLSQSWKDVKPVDAEGRTFVELNDDLVVMGRQYEARVRVKPKDPVNKGQFRGQWSDWSPSVNWTSDIGRREITEDTLTPETGLLWIFITLSFILVILITMCIAHRCCMLRAGSEHIPDPSKYFQPLLSVHGGNFQKWLGPQHSTDSFLAPQSDCDISPVEVSGVVDSTLADKMLHLHPNLTSPSQETSSYGQSSSGFSNMGYFYSETQPGTLNLETCSVYFTYHPEEGSNNVLQPTSSYEHLQSLGQNPGQPSSPDSGFGMGGEEEEDEDEEEGRNEEHSVINIQHLVSFVLSFPERQRANASVTAAQVPLSFGQLPEALPWPEAEVEDAAVGLGSSSESLEGPVVRPSSMVVQPCSSGYLTLKEMQKYSNKSI